MKNIKSYEDFCNEEINLKRAITGAAIGAGLALGSPAKSQSITTDPPKKSMRQDSTSTKGSKSPKFKYKTIPADITKLSEIPEEDVQLTLKKPYGSKYISRPDDVVVKGK